MAIGSTTFVDRAKLLRWEIDECGSTNCQLPCERVMAIGSALVAKDNPAQFLGCTSFVKRLDVLLIAVEQLVHVPGTFQLPIGDRERLAQALHQDHAVGANTLLCELIWILPGSRVLLALVEEAVLTKPICDLQLYQVISSQIRRMHRILAVR